MGAGESAARTPLWRVPVTMMPSPPACAAVAAASSALALWASTASTSAVVDSRICPKRFINFPLFCLGPSAPEREASKAGTVIVYFFDRH